jgi:hypothetical protein
MAYKLYNLILLGQCWIRLSLICSLTCGGPTKHVDHNRGRSAQYPRGGSDTILKSNKLNMVLEPLFGCWTYLPPIVATLCMLVHIMTHSNTHTHIHTSNIICKKCKNNYQFFYLKKKNLQTNMIMNLISATST